MNTVIITLLFLGIAFIQILIGGMRPVFAIPGYGLLALAGLLSVFKLTKVRSLPSAACIVSTLLFAGYILGRSYFSPVEYLARPDRWMVLGCLIVYLLIALYFSDPKMRIALFIALIVLASGHLLIGAIQFSKENNYLPFGYLRPDYGRRASGFYGCPNHLAGLLEMLLAAGGALLLRGRMGIKSRMLLLYFLCIALVGVGITGSRGGYLSTAFALLVFFLLSLAILRKVRPDRFLVVACMSFLMLLAVGAGSIAIMKRDFLLASRLHSLVDTNNMRLQLWHAALLQFQQQPAVGTGSGTYLYLGRLHRDPSLNVDPVWVHNDYLHLLAEYGLLGAATFLLFLGAHLWQGVAAWKALRQRMWASNLLTSNSLALNVAALTALAALMAHSVVDFNLHIPGNALVLAIFLGMLANPPLKKPEPITLPTHWPQFGWRLLLPLLAVALLAGTLPRWKGEWFAEKARVALRDSKFLPAIRHARSSIASDQTNPNAYYHLGEAQRMIGNSFSNPIARQKMNEAAVMAFDQSIKLFPQDEKLWVKKSQALDMIGLHDAALQSLNQALALDPHLPALNTYFGAHYELLGNSALALQYYDKARGDKISTAGKQKLLEQIKEDAAR